MYNDSKFKDILNIITYFILPIIAIIWPFFVFGFAKFNMVIFWILLQIFILMVLNLLIEKAFDCDDMDTFFGIGSLASLALFALYWPFVVCPLKIAPIIGLVEIAVLSIAIDLLFDDMDFLEIVFVVALSLLAVYWPWIVFPFKAALVILIVETGVILFGVGVYTEIESMRNAGIAICAILAVGWPWVFLHWNMAIIVILAELFLLALIYEIFKGFEDQGIVIGMLLFLLLLAVGWPWLAFIEFEKYLWYAIPASVISGAVAGFASKIVIGLKK